MSSSPNPNNPGQFITGQPQVRVISSNPLQGQNMGSFPFNLLAGQSQTQPQSQPQNINPLAQGVNPLGSRPTGQNIGGRTVVLF